MTTSIPKGHYLVLGATGLVGSHALESLKGVEGVSVKAVHHNKKPFIQADNISYVQADLTNAQRSAELFTGIDYVLMFAGVLATPPVVEKDPVQPAMQTLRMTMHCLEAAYHAKVKKFLWMSGTSGYPSSNEKLTEEKMFEGEPPDAYYSIGWAMRYLEVLCRLYSEKLKEKMTTIVLRPSMIYGEYANFDASTAHFLPATVRKIVEKQVRTEISGAGTEERDFIYVGDVIEACFLALAKLDQYEVLNIASGKSYSINEVLNKIIKLEGHHDAQIVRTQPRPQSAISRAFDNQKAAKVIGFTAKTSLDDGLRKTIAWYKKEVAYVQ